MIQVVLEHAQDFLSENPNIYKQNKFLSFYSPSSSMVERSAVDAVRLRQIALHEKQPANTERLLVRVAINSKGIYGRKLRRWGYLFFNTFSYKPKNSLHYNNLKLWPYIWVKP